MISEQEVERNDASDVAHNHSLKHNQNRSFLDCNAYLYIQRIRITAHKALRELLLDEEGTQMTQLPCACDAQHAQLNNHPARDTCICCL